MYTCGKYSLRDLQYSTCLSKHGTLLRHDYRLTQRILVWTLIVYFSEDLHKTTCVHLFTHA